MSDDGAIPCENVDDERRSLTQPGGLPGQSIYDRVVGLEYESRIRREKEAALELRLREGAVAFFNKLYPEGTVGSTYHMPDPVQAAFVEAHLLANV